MQDGRDCGEGRAEGEEIGFRKGEEQLGILIEKLLQEGKVELVQKAVTDSKIRDELYKEYGL